MNITVNVLRLCRSERATSNAAATFKHMILSTLQKSRPRDQALPVSILESNLDGCRKPLVHAAIGELRESGAIEFAYSEGWTVGVRLTSKGLARPGWRILGTLDGGEA